MMQQLLWWEMQLLIQFAKDPRIEQGEEDHHGQQWTTDIAVWDCLAG